MARNRNRKRPRDRRPARPGDAALATAGGERLDAPDPLSHATPDAELAEAQLALGRPDLAEAPDEEELDELAENAGSGGGGRRRGGEAQADGLAGSPGGASAPAAHGESLSARLVNFLQGSWHELQRVQWPDRRQVFQATGVVLGFVIVIGVFLGVADVVAQKVVNLILYGHT
ncbi:MAG TPA: preprotein translocase subunit SecE [Solirubrobacteraceae bacterium]|nr:preprotein translocase subunit SecE [Solirubrobacteraceae bacterium]